MIDSVTDLVNKLLSEGSTPEQVRETINAAIEERAKYDRAFQDGYAQALEDTEGPTQQELEGAYQHGFSDGRDDGLESDLTWEMYYKGSYRTFKVLGIKSGVEGPLLLVHELTKDGRPVNDTRSYHMAIGESVMGQGEHVWEC